MEKQVRGLWRSWNVCWPDSFRCVGAHSSLLAYPALVAADTVLRAAVVSALPSATRSETGAAAAAGVVSLGGMPACGLDDGTFDVSLSVYGTRNNGTR